MNKIDKIDKIDKLLENDDYFEKYIQDISMYHINVPSTLETDIISRLKLPSNCKSKSETKVYKFKMQDILKIVACTVFAVAMWQFTLSKYTSVAYASQKENIRYERHQIYDKIDNVMKSINGFFMNPIDMKGDNK